MDSSIVLSKDFKHITGNYDLSIEASEAEFELVDSLGEPYHVAVLYSIEKDLKVLCRVSCTVRPKGKDFYGLLKRYFSQDDMNIDVKEFENAMNLANKLCEFFKLFGNRCTLDDLQVYMSNIAIKIKANTTHNLLVV